MSTKTRKSTYYSRFSLTSNFGYSDQSISSTSVDETRTGVAMPKWKSVIKAGGNATTPLSGTRYRQLAYTELIGSVKIDRATPRPNGDMFDLERYVGCPDWAVTWPTPVQPDFSEADYQALSRLYKAIRAQQRQMTGGVTLGELRETIQFMRRPLRGIVDGLDKYFQTIVTRRGKVRLKDRTNSQKRKILTDMVSDTWLESSLAIQPLLADVKAIAETVARFQVDNRQHKVRGYGSKEEFVPVIANTKHLYLNVRTDGGVRRNAEVIYQAALGKTTDAPFGTMARLAELSGFTLNNFVPTLWELIPYSFLVDYFINIGEGLEAMCTDTSSVLWCKRTERFNEAFIAKFTAQLEPGGNPAFVHTTQQEGSVTNLRTRMARTPLLNGIPVLPLRVSLPGSANQALNMIALVNSRNKATMSALRY